MAFLDLVNELTGTVPGLSPLLAEKYINRAWAHVRSKRNWQFLVTDLAIACPTQITAGTISISQFSTAVTCDATASAALLAQDVIGTPALEQMSIRFGATSPAIGQVYNISVVDQSIPAAVVLQLNRPVMEATNATSGYQCYRPYIQPPADFLAWSSFVDMVNGWPLFSADSPYTSAYFDARDPQRAAQGLATILGSYAGAYIPVGDTLTNPFPNMAIGATAYELWPHPTSGQTFYARYRRRGVDFTSPTDELPQVISDGLILSRALYADAYPFAKANVANFPSFKGADWNGLITNQKKKFDDDLVDAKRNDNENALQDVWFRGHGLRWAGSGFRGAPGFPIDSNYMQSHLIRF